MLLLDGRVELSFLFHLYINLPKLQAKHENVTVALGCTIIGSGDMIICGQGTIKIHKHYTQVNFLNNNEIIYVPVMLQYAKFEFTTPTIFSMTQ